MSVCVIARTCQLFSHEDKDLTYENILYDNVKMLADYILGKSDKLTFNIPLVQLKRNDEIAKKKEF